MQFLKNIFGRIWAVWGIILFIITLLLFFVPLSLCFLWKEPLRSKMSHPIFKLWMNIYLPSVGVFLKIIGKENFKKGKNYIVVCNHVSLMDVPILCPYVPGPNKTIAKIEMSRIPLFGTLYKLGSVLVNRKDKNSRIKSYVQMKEVLKNKLHMCIFPEGTRNKSNQPLKEFHDGAFKLSVETQHEIIPTIIIGTDKILPHNKTFYFMPGKVKCYFLPPLQPNNGVEQLKEQAFVTMWKYIQENK